MRYLAILLCMCTVLVPESFAAAQTTSGSTPGFGGAVAGSGGAANPGSVGSTGTTNSPATGGAARATGPTAGVTTPSLTCSRADLLDSAPVTLGCQ